MIDPKVSLWLNIVLTIMIGISTGAVSLTNIVDPVISKSVVGWCGFGAFILGTINTALHAMANSVTGRISAATALPEVKKVEISPNATGVAIEMARDHEEPKVGLPK